MISDYGAIASKLTGVPGWLTDDEENLLRVYAGAVPESGCIINIGVEFGRSLAALTKFSSIPQVIGIDKAVLIAASLNMDEAGLSGRYVLVEKDSQFVDYQGAPIDLIFIDGDHSIKGVERDIMNWTPRVKAGGVVVFHDCACITNRSPHASHFDVTYAITGWLNTTKERWKLDRMVDSMMAFRKIQDEPFESSTL